MNGPRQRRISGEGSWSTTNQNVRSAGSGNTQAKVKLWRQPHTRSQPPMRQRNFMHIYALGVTLGTSRKMKEGPRGIADSRLNRPREVDVESDRHRRERQSRAAQHPHRPGLGEVSRVYHRPVSGDEVRPVAYAGDPPRQDSHRRGRGRGSHSVGCRPRAYKDFDKGAAKRFVLDPHGMVSKVGAGFVRFLVAWIRCYLQSKKIILGSAMEQP
jgi:hypothetical protein